MKKLKPICRILLGIALIVFGLNGFFQFMPPPEISAEGMSFIVSLMATKYMFVMLNVFKLLFGFCLLINRFTALSLLLLTPITVNILCFHLFLDIKGILMIAIITVLHGYLLYAYRSYYKTLLSDKLPLNATIKS